MIYIFVPIESVARKVQTGSAGVKLDSCIARIAVHYAPATIFGGSNQE